MKTWTYRGFTIERTPHNGMYSAWLCNHHYCGYLKTDTLQGMREIIRHYQTT
jgi:hypothetical protein